MMHPGPAQPGRADRQVILHPALVHLDDGPALVITARDGQLRLDITLTQSEARTLALRLRLLLDRAKGLPQ